LCRRKRARASRAGSTGAGAFRGGLQRFRDGWFRHAFASNASPENAIELATACAAANCVADAPGTARLSDIQDILPSVRVQILSE